METLLVREPHLRVEHGGHEPCKPREVVNLLARAKKRPLDRRQVHNNLEHLRGEGEGARWNWITAVVCIDIGATKISFHSFPEQNIRDLGIV
jgi:hypothetical protein